MDNLDFPTPSLEEIRLMEWAQVRVKRDQLISDTDWTQLADSPLSAEKKAEFAAYRQALRDLPQSTVEPDEVVWPSMPL